MLDIKNAIRVEYDTYVSGNTKVYVFVCKGGCGKEVRIQNQALSRRSGKCVRCTKRNRHPYQTLYNSFVSSVKRRDKVIENTLSFEDFLFLTDIRCCCYCNATVQWKEYRNGPYNLDRKDSSKGYSLDNVVVCCYRCNSIKRNFYNHEEFSAIMLYMRWWRDASDEERAQLEFDITSDIHTRKHGYLL